MEKLPVSLFTVLLNVLSELRGDFLCRVSEDIRQYGTERWLSVKEFKTYADVLTSTTTHDSGKFCE